MFITVISVYQIGYLSRTVSLKVLDFVTNITANSYWLIGVELAVGKFVIMNLFPIIFYIFLSIQK